MLEVVKGEGNNVGLYGVKTSKTHEYEYVLPTLDVINSRINSFVESHKDIAKIETLGITKLGYPLTHITIGNGPKDLFIVGGTHSNEIIAVDVISQFLSKMDEEFDKNLLNDVTLHIIPIQNPEGYKVLDSLMNEINDYLNLTGITLQDFTNEYYTNYRTDSLINISFREMNKFMTDENFIAHFRDYIENNEAYKRLHLQNALPTLNKTFAYSKDENDEDILSTFDEALLGIDPELPLKDYLYQARFIIMFTMTKLDLNNKYDSALKIYLEMLFTALDEPIHEIDLNATNKLHQQMLNEISINSLKKLKEHIAEETKNNEPLSIDLGTSCLMQCTKEEAHKMMVEFASTVVDSVNLNGNTPYSPGIEIERTGQVYYSKNGSISNIRNYSKNSPLGSSIPGKIDPTMAFNEGNMRYAIENTLLEDLLISSIEKGTYGACILCHGTGGELYYKPNEELTGSNYLNYSEANESIVLDIQNAIDKSIEDLDPDRYANLVATNSHYYKKKDAADKTGYGDLLRSRYPRVIMYENSVMGGNPFGPYGDTANYIRTNNCFNSAIEGACKNLIYTYNDNPPGHGTL